MQARTTATITASTPTTHHTRSRLPMRSVWAICILGALVLLSGGVQAAVIPQRGIRKGCFLGLTVENIWVLIASHFLVMEPAITISANVPVFTESPRAFPTKTNSDTITIPDDSVHVHARNHQPEPTFIPPDQFKLKLVRTMLLNAPDYIMIGAIAGGYVVGAAVIFLLPRFIVAIRAKRFARSQEKDRAFETLGRSNTGTGPYPTLRSRSTSRRPPAPWQKAQKRATLIAAASSNGRFRRGPAPEMASMKEVEPALVSSEKGVRGSPSFDKGTAGRRGEKEPSPGLGSSVSSGGTYINSQNGPDRQVVESMLASYGWEGRGPMPNGAMVDPSVTARYAPNPRMPGTLPRSLNSSPSPTPTYLSSERLLDPPSLARSRTESPGGYASLRRTQEAGGTNPSLSRSRTEINSTYSRVAIPARKGVDSYASEYESTLQRNGSRRGPPDPREQEDEQRKHHEFMKLMSDFSQSGNDGPIELRKY
ncbi:hypothetical protein HK104_002725 [Borealophlyctis nickersoniae]|nr:hypothetical protein HK104_002725 [Borealophlyctis nickersoniae]